MTTEERIKAALDYHRKEMDRLTKQYNRSFDNVSVNECGEANGDEIVSINEWYDRERERIDKEFGDMLKRAAGR